MEETKILNSVCLYFGITQQELGSNTRKKKYVKPRMYLAYFLWKYSHHKPEQTVAFMLDKLKLARDRGTIYHYLDTISDYISVKDAETENDLYYLTKMIDDTSFAVPLVVGGVPITFVCKRNNENIRVVDVQCANMVGMIKNIFGDLGREFILNAEQEIKKQC